MSQITNIKSINSDLTAEVVNSLNTVQPSADGTKTIGLNFESATGSISDAITLINGIHKSDVDLSSTGSGELGLAAIILLAGGKPGDRTANSSATFSFSADVNLVGKKRKDLTTEEKNALEILNKFTGREKTRIKSLMLSGAKLTSAEMIKLGLVDQVEGGFVDKYEQFRKVTKKGK